MKQVNRIETDAGGAIATGSWKKFLLDSWSILEIKVIVTRRHLLWHAMGSLIIPLSMFYWATAIASERFEASFRFWWAL